MVWFGADSIGEFQPSLRDLVLFFDSGPSDESLGYSQLSLRDTSRLARVCDNRLARLPLSVELMAIVRRRVRGWGCTVELRFAG